MPNHTQPNAIVNLNMDLKENPYGFILLCGSILVFIWGIEKFQKFIQKS